MKIEVIGVCDTDLPKSIATPQSPLHGENRSVTSQRLFPADPLSGPSARADIDSWNVMARTAAANPQDHAICLLMSDPVRNVRRVKEQGLVQGTCLIQTYSH